MNKKRAVVSCRGSGGACSYSLLLASVNRTTACGCVQRWGGGYSIPCIHGVGVHSPANSREKPTVTRMKPPSPLFLGRVPPESRAHGKKENNTRFNKSTKPSSKSMLGILASKWFIVWFRIQANTLQSTSSVRVSPP